MKKKQQEEMYCVVLYFQGDQYYIDQNLNTNKGIIELRKEVAEDVAVREYNKLRRFDANCKIAVKKI